MITRCWRYTVSVLEKALSNPPGEYAARVKLKGIDGGPAQAVEYVV